MVRHWYNGAKKLFFLMKRSEFSNLFNKNLQNEAVKIEKVELQWRKISKTINAFEFKKKSFVSNGTQIKTHSWKVYRVDVDYNNYKIQYMEKKIKINGFNFKLIANCEFYS